MLQINTTIISNYYVFLIRKSRERYLPDQEIGVSFQSFLYLQTLDKLLYKYTRLS